MEVISLWLISSHTFLNFFPKSLWHSSHAFGFLNRTVMLCASKMCSFKFEVLVVWETLLSSGNNICSRNFLMLLLCVLLRSVDLNLLSFSQQSVFAVSALLSLFIATSPISQPSYCGSWNLKWIHLFLFKEVKAFVVGVVMSICAGGTLGYVFIWMSGLSYIHEGLHSKTVSSHYVS